MKRYDEEPERRQGLEDREACRRKYLEMMDSGQVKSALTVVLMEPEAGDDPEAVRMALLSDGVSTVEARELVRHALGALNAIIRRKPEEPEPERVIEAHGRLAEQWLRYAAYMELDTAPPEAYTLARKSFYAGVAALHGLLIDAGNPDQSPAAALALVTALTTELREFCLAELIDDEPASHARH